MKRKPPKKKRAASTQNSGRNSGAANLKPFAKGVSGNPGGRPSTAWIREYLSGLGDKTDTRREKYLEALYKTAIDRKHRDHVKAGLGLMAYDFGKPIQAVELTGKDGGPIASTVDSVVSTMTSEDKRKRIAELLAKAGGKLPVAEEAAAAPDDDDGDAELDDE